MVSSELNKASWFTIVALRGQDVLPIRQGVRLLSSLWKDDDDVRIQATALNDNGEDKDVSAVP